MSSANREALSERERLPAARPGEGAPARRAYMIVALLLGLLSMAFLGYAVLAAPRPNSQAQGTLIDRLLPFFPVMLTYSAIAMTLPFTGGATARWARAQAVFAPLYGLCAVLYGYLGYWAVWQLSVSGPFVRWRFWMIFAAGLVLIAIVALNGIAFAQVLARRMAGIDSEGASREERVELMARGIYVLGGLSLVVLPLARMWLAGFELWANAASVPNVDWVYAGIFAHPICVALGCIGVMLGIAQNNVRLIGWLRPVAAAAYIGGAALLAFGVYRLTVGHGSVRPGAGMTIGFILVLGALAVNLAGTVRSSIARA